MSTSPLDRRSFVKLSLAAGAVAAAVPGRLFSAETAGTDAGFTVPKLAYDYAALEPHIDAKTMELHHDKHHAAYVTNLNTAVAANASLKGKTIGELLVNLPAIDDEANRTAVRNNGGGHWNHSFFWESMAPAGKTGEVSAPLAKAIKDAFGSMDDFKKKFGEAATKRFGSGWAWLIVKNGKLLITSSPNQDNPLMKGIVPEAELGTPLLGLDVWEHAYYLHYMNKRPDYITAFWNVVDWASVSKRFSAA